MSSVRKVTDDLYWVGINDKRQSRFENIHPVPQGFSCNSYLLMDKKRVLFDTVDWSGCRTFLKNVAQVLNGKDLDYLVVNHMEPDHAACLEEILLRYPNCRIMSNEKAFMFMQQYGFHVEGRREEVKEGDVKSFGRHRVTFVMAPMVHWPEAMVTYDETDGILFSADAFGSFGSLDGQLFADEAKEGGLDEARRYYSNIVGKYGPFVQNLMAKLQKLQVKMICPLHGPIWRKNLDYILKKYDLWSRYEPEEKGVLIAYASMYGNTEEAAQSLASMLRAKGAEAVSVYDVSDTHVSYLVSEAFRYSHIVLASVTYNLEIFPDMYIFLHHLKCLRLQNRTFGLIENGTWAIKAGTLMKEYVEENLPSCRVLDTQVSVNSTPNEANEPELESLTELLLQELQSGKGS